MSNFLSRIIAGAVSGVLAFTAFSTEILSVSAETINFDSKLELNSEAVYMENLDTGDVVVSINADEQRTPASITKIMTAIVLFEQIGSDTETLENITVKANYKAFEDLDAVGGYSNADIRVDEKLTYLDLLYALLMSSACEAANIIAINVAGSEEAFVAMMNAKAITLGMDNTHFSNAHGLFAENNYTTCEDIAIMTKYAIDNYPLFMEVCETTSYTMKATQEHPDGTVIATTNSMMLSSSDYYYPYTKGIKTGTLDEAGRCLVTTAQKGDYTYLIVSLGAPQYDEDGNSVMYNCIDHKALYQWAFDTLKFQTLVYEDEDLTSVPVAYGDGADSVNLHPVEQYSCIWSEEIPVTDITRKISVDPDVVAPVKVGDTLGTLTLQYNGKTIANIDLVASSSVERAVVESKAKVASAFFSSKQFKIGFLVIVGIIILYTVFFIVYMNRVKKKRAEQKRRERLESVQRRMNRQK